MFVVVTKIDMCPANVLQDTLKLLTRVLKSPGCRKIPVMVQSHDDVITSAVNFTSERYTSANVCFMHITLIPVWPIHTYIICTQTPIMAIQIVHHKI